MTRRRGAWIRYGSDLTDAQVDFAVEHYAVTVLQPWEVAAAARLKAARPDMTVLAYKCLSSTRDYEPGPVHTSGVCHEEAEEWGEEWFAHREDGSRIEWSSYPGHWQMAVWDEDYQERWCENVAAELEGSPWDGVMADNDVYDDYYGLRPPLEGGRGLPELRAALDVLVPRAGERLRAGGKLLVPNIAESRREPGRWARHSAWGGGFEEVWLSWGTGADDHLGPADVVAQAREVFAGGGITVLRTATDGGVDHPGFGYGLAATWVFGGDRRIAFASTGHDEYTGTPWHPSLDWDLGRPLEEPQQRGNAWSRSFSDGWAAVNTNAGPRRRVRFAVPDGMVDGATGRPVTGRVALEPHEGLLLLREGSPRR